MRSFIIDAILALSFVALFTGAGCPPPKPTPLDMGRAADLHVPIDAGACQLTALPTTDDICNGVDVGGLFTQPEGYACVKCKGAGGCVDTVDSVYCVVDQNCSDPKCAAPPRLVKPTFKKARAGGK